VLSFLLIIFGTAGLTWFAVENNVSNAEELYQAMGGTGVLILLIAFVVAQPFMFIGAKKAAAWFSDRFDE
jgi:hypothetical protein